jgi:hypothetical protein
MNKQSVILDRMFLDCAIPMEARVCITLWLLDNDMRLAPKELDEYAKLVQGGQYIGAIKLHRERNGSDLKTAKEFVDANYGHLKPASSYASNN